MNAAVWSERCIDVTAAARVSWVVSNVRVHVIQ